MDIKCSAVTSIKVDLTFDDHKTKEAVIGVGDLIYVEYNANGCRKSIEGKVLKVSAVGTDPHGWYIIVDGSDDFDSERARFSPMNILDLAIIRKADTLEDVKTVIGVGSVPYIRIVEGRLQYSKDGYNWHPISVDRRDIIEPQEGTVPLNPTCHCDCNTSSDDNATTVGEDNDNIDGIQDANY
jgi:hypothetical protein